MLTENTVEEEQALVEQLQRRWMIGSDEPLPLDALPQNWRPFIETQAIARHSLLALALASQHQSVLFQPQAPAGLTPHPSLPDLQQPVIPDRLRPLFRRIIESINKQSILKPGIFLRQLLYRGYIAHPADWLPSAADEDLPDIYIPWCIWASNELGTLQNHEHQNLDEDNWDDWYPAERLSLLKALRFKNAAAARSLIKTCAIREPADKRLKVIQTLAINLSDDDAAYLQELLNDRSQKIVTLAAQYLARLGKTSRPTLEDGKANNTKELAEGYELKKSGVIKKRLQLVPLKLKSKKQQSVRSEQLENTPLVDFANALDIDVEQLVTSWQFSENRPHDNQAFVANAVKTLADVGIELLIDNLLKHLASNEADLHLLQMLIPRLTDHNRASLTLTILKQPSINYTFYDCLSFLNSPLEAFDWETLKAARPWINLLKALEQELQENGYITNPSIARELMALGLILPHSLAEQTLTAIFDLGTLRADPVTDLLKFNADLHPITNTHARIHL